MLSTAIVEAQDLALELNGRQILTGVSFSQQKGEFVYLIGRTGAGKSSFLRLLYADHTPSKGQLSVANFALNKIKDSEVPFLRRKLGIVFQDFQLLPDRTIAENILFAMRASGWTDNARMKARLSEVLMQVGLSNKAASYPYQLSGGEQQRTAIARALVNDPLLLIADEPTGNLDPEVTEHIMEILHKVNRAGTAVLMATHAHDLLQRYPARVMECRDHTLMERAAK